MILVVGATGQLGAAVVRKLVEKGSPVRALARATSSYQHLERPGVELVFGDLRDAASLFAACENVETVIATANAAVPSQSGDSFKAIDGQGYRNLIEACKQQGVRRFVYTSVSISPMDDQIPLLREKRLTEKRLQESGLDYTIFRADAFMDVAFAMMGSDIPVKGSEVATVRRPFWFSSRFFNSVKDGIGKKGEVQIPGKGTARRSFISIDNVADFLVKSVDHTQARNAVFDIGGPQVLSYNDVMTVFEKVLGTPLTARHAPAVIFRIGLFLLKPFSPAAADIMGINYLSATVESVIDMEETARTFGVTLTSAEEFLRGKMSLSD